MRSADWPPGTLALAALAALAGAGLARAQTVPAPAPASAAASSAETQRVEIRGATADDTEQRRREPVAKTIYGREELDKYGDTSVTDVLKRLPGINLSGGNPRMRGLGAGYTLILINGEPAPPGFSLENLPPSQVERIEVTKGATAEHSTQAVAGTINIILRAAPRQRQREVGLRIGYSKYRPVGGLNVTLGDRFGDWSVALPFNTFQWSGGTGNESVRVTRALAGREPVTTDDIYRHAGHWQMLRTGLNLVRRFGDGSRLEANVAVHHSDSANRTLTKNYAGSGALVYDRIVDGSTSEQSRTTRGKFTHPWRESHTLAAGWDLKAQQRREVRSYLQNGADQLQGFESEPFRAHVRQAAGFVQDEWEISPQWSTYLGLRIETITTTSQGLDDTLRSRSEVVTPVVHVNYKLDPKGRDLIRASVTRAYKAPELTALMARPWINSSYPLDTTNPEGAPDRVGNPALRPELSTNVDLAFEKYLTDGGVISVGVFHRHITGLIRSVVSEDPERVDWATALRYISRPVNLEGARSTGVEIELKGRAGELLPSIGLPQDMNLRASISAYRSRVNDIPGPNNRLESQQPWSLTIGFDHRVSGTPLGLGANLAYTPGYVTQQTPAASLEQNRVRTLDAYLSWTFSREATFRLSVNNALPLDVATLARTVEQGGYVQTNDSLRRNRPNWNAGLALKF